MSLLNRPEYIHVLINHFPLVGLLVATLALVAGLVSRNREATLAGLALVALLSLSAWPAYSYGEAGYDRVLSMSDDAGGTFLDHHKELAERWLFLYFVTAGVAGLGFGLAWKWPRTLLWFSVAALTLAALSLVAGFCIARAGGEVRHPEFRSEAPPPRQERVGVRELPVAQTSGLLCRRLPVCKAQELRERSRPARVVQFGASAGRRPAIQQTGGLRYVAKNSRMRP